MKPDQYRGGSCDDGKADGRHRGDRSRRRQRHAPDDGDARILDRELEATEFACLHPAPPFDCPAPRLHRLDRPHRSASRPTRRPGRLPALQSPHPDGVLGFPDEVWWRRVAQPQRRTWVKPAQPLRVVDQTVAKDAPDPKARAGSGVLRAAVDRVWLRYVAGRPVSPVPTPFLGGCCARLATDGTRVVVLVGDNAAWQRSRDVRAWIRTHNRQATPTGRGGRLRVCASLGCAHEPDRAFPASGE